jgi:hypothetical protein
MCGSDQNAPGYSRLPIDHVVIHHNATMNKNVALSTWLTTGPAQTSAHYEVTPTEIIGCVEEERSAWHAGTSNMNRRSIGIEHLNSTLGPKWEVAEATLKNSARLCADICKRYGIPIDSAHIIPHKAVVSTACPGGINMAHYIDLVKQAAGQPVTASAAVAAQPATTQAPAVNVTYDLHQLGGSWLGEVTNFNNSNSQGFAGNPNHAHDALVVKVSHGSVKYRVHTPQDGWLPYVTGYDRGNAANGFAGIMGHAIDGVQVYYTTPAGETFQQAYYRSQTTQRAGWLPAVRDDIDYAGMLGEPLDRLQVKIAPSNPF